MLQTIVKISGVTNLSDARYCAGMGVTMLGFVMDADAPNYMPPTRFAEIRGWVSGVQIVGETASTDPDQVRQLVETYQPDLLQVDKAALLPLLADLGKPMILKLAISAHNPALLEAHSLPTKPDYLLLDGPDSVLLSHAWQQALTTVAAQQPVLLGAGLTLTELPTLLNSLPITGIALTGGPEERPGYRDFGALMDILEWLEVES